MCAHLRQHPSRVFLRSLCLTAILWALALPAPAAAKEFCVCVFGQTSKPKGIGKATIKVNGQIVEVDLTKIEVVDNGDPDAPDITQAESFVKVAAGLRKGTKEVPGAAVGELLNGNCFTVTAESVTIVGDGAPDEPTLEIKIQDGACKGVAEWVTSVPIPLLADPKPRKVLDDLSFTETEALAANGDLVSCINFKNESAGDLTIQGPIFLMLNWTDADDQPKHSAHFDDKCPAGLPFACVKGVKVPKKNSAGGKTTTAQGNATIDTDPGAGTVKICWTIKKDDIQTKLPGFSLSRKYLAYIDIWAAQVDRLRIVPINYWVKPKALQAGGTEQCYNWYPTNPAFNVSTIAMSFPLDLAELPADWTVTAISPGADEILTMAPHEMQAGSFCLSIPATTPCALGRVMVLGVDADTGAVAMIDNTEVRATPPTGSIDAARPACSVSPPQTNANGQTFVTIRAQDLGSGLASIQPILADNVILDIPPFTPGSHGEVSVIATKDNPGESSRIELKVVDQCRLVTRCDPVITLLVRERGRPVDQTLTGIPREESKIALHNGTPGLSNLDVVVNGTRFKIAGLTDGGQATLDVSAAMIGGNNLIVLKAFGKPGSSAAVVISD